MNSKTNFLAILVFILQSSVCRPKDGGLAMESIYVSGREK